MLLTIFILFAYSSYKQLFPHTPLFFLSLEDNKKDNETFHNTV